MTEELTDMLEVLLATIEKLDGVCVRLDEAEARFNEYEKRHFAAMERLNERLDQMAVLVGSEVGLDAKTVQRPERIGERLTALEERADASRELASLREDIRKLRTSLSAAPPTMQDMLKKMKEHSALKKAEMKGSEGW